MKSCCDEAWYKPKLEDVKALSVDYVLSNVALTDLVKSVANSVV